MCNTKQLVGWWFYDFANSVMASVVVPVLFPLLIEELTFQQGQNCIGRDCKVWLGPLQVSSLSYVFYVTCISVVCQAIVFISIGALADYGNWRKRLLITTTLIGSFTTMTVLLLDTYWQVALFSILANILFGTSVIFYNAYLPLLVKEHPDYVTFDKEDFDGLQAKSEEIANSISTRGYVFGYIAGIITIVGCGAIVYLFNQSILSMQLAITAGGIWWLLFSFVTFALLPSKPGPNLPKDSSYLFVSLKRFASIFSQSKRHRNSLLFLVSYFLFADGYITLSRVAVLYGKTQLNMSNVEMLLIALIVPTCAIPGNLLTLRLQKRFNVTTKSTLLLLLSLMLLIPSYALISFATKTVLQTQTEVFVMSSLYGLLVGALQSYSRVLFTQLVPAENASTWFALYEITDKGSAWLGSLLVGIVVNWDVRGCWIVVAGLLVIGTLLATRVRVVNLRRVTSFDF